MIGRAPQRGSGPVLFFFPFGIRPQNPVLKNLKRSIQIPKAVHDTAGGKCCSVFSEFGHGYALVESARVRANLKSNLSGSPEKHLALPDLDNPLIY